MFLTSFIFILAATKVELSSSSSDYKTIADVLGVSAVITNDLKQRRQRDYDFDWKKALQVSGDTGIKLQYTHTIIFLVNTSYTLMLQQHVACCELSTVKHNKKHNKHTGNYFSMPLHIYVHKCIARLATNTKLPAMLQMSGA